MVVHKGLKALVDILINDFYVLVGLRVTGCTKFLFRPKEFIEFISEYRDKLGALVRGNSFQLSIDPLDLVIIKPYGVLGYSVLSIRGRVGFLS